VTPALAVGAATIAGSFSAPSTAVGSYIKMTPMGPAAASGGAHGGQGGTTTGGSGGGYGGTGATQERPGYPASNGISGAIPGGYLRGWSAYANTDGGGGGGGGGGLYGGGSGANNTNDGGGGGGSSYAHPDLTSSTTEAGSGTGSGATPGGDDHALYVSGVGIGGHNTTDGGPGLVVLRWAK